MGDGGILLDADGKVVTDEDGKAVPCEESGTSCVDCTDITPSQMMVEILTDTTCSGCVPHFSQPRSGQMPTLPSFIGTYLLDQDGSDPCLWVYQSVSELFPAWNLYVASDVCGSSPTVVPAQKLIIEVEISESLGQERMFLHIKSEDYSAPGSNGGIELYSAFKNISDDLCCSDTSTSFTTGDTPNNCRVLLDGFNHWSILSPKNVSADVTPVASCP